VRLATGTEKGRTRVESGPKRACLSTVQWCGREGPNVGAPDTNPWPRSGLL